MHFMDELLGGMKKEAHKKMPKSWNKDKGINTLIALEWRVGEHEF